jgi:hypothetical protein
VVLSNSVNLDEENLPIISDFAIVGAPLPNAVLEKVEYDFVLGKGGFLPSGAYYFDTTNAPPKPWSNVHSLLSRVLVQGISQRRTMSVDATMSIS